jgi:hypothetical protein
MANVPAWLSGRKSEPFGDNEDLLGGIGGALPAHLSINMNRFTLVDGAGNTREPAMSIDICIIASNPKASRVYYDPARRYDPSGSDNAPPLCWSDNGLGPSRNSQIPQSPTCALCPNAVWGSAVSQMTGRNIPACQTGKKIALLVPGDADDMVYMFKIPPASLKNLAQYVKSLAGNTLGGRTAKPSDVITRLEFESQGVVKFSPVGIIDEDMFNRTEKWYGQPEVINQLTGRDDVAIDPAAVGQAPKSDSIRQQALNTIVPPPKPTAPIAPPAEKKRGRPAKQADVTDLPPFIKSQPAPAKQPEPIGPGMVEAPAPSSEISAALDNVFNLPGIT